MGMCRLCESKKKTEWACVRRQHEIKGEGQSGWMCMYAM